MISEEMETFLKRHRGAIKIAAFCFVSAMGMRNIQKMRSRTIKTDPNGQSTYSFLGSSLHLVLEDALAEAYNRVVDAFIDAQSDHRERTGRQWTPKEYLLMDTNNYDQKAYKKVGKIIDFLIKERSIHITEDDITSDYLEKLR